MRHFFEPYIYSVGTENPYWVIIKAASLRKSFLGCVNNLLNKINLGEKLTSHFWVRKPFRTMDFIELFRLARGLLLGFASLNAIKRCDTEGIP